MAHCWYRFINIDTYKWSKSPTSFWTCACVAAAATAATWKSTKRSLIRDQKEPKINQIQTWNRTKIDQNRPKWTKMDQNGECLCAYRGVHGGAEEVQLAHKKLICLSEKHRSFSVEDSWFSLWKLTWPISTFVVWSEGASPWFLKYKVHQFECEVHNTKFIMFNAKAPRQRVREWLLTTTRMIRESIKDSKWSQNGVKLEWNGVHWLNSNFSVPLSIETAAIFNRNSQ